MEIRLLVLRTGDTKKLADFYSLLGANFEYHKHDNSPYHYSAKTGSAILEIYPLTKHQAEADKSLRLGFEINNFEEVLHTLKENKTPTTEPAQTNFGFMTITTDPDGRKVELYKKDS